MKRDDTVYLQHILDAIAKAQSYLLDVDEASFSPIPSSKMVSSGRSRSLAKPRNVYPTSCAPNTHRFLGMTLPACGTSSFTITSV